MNSHCDSFEKMPHYIFHLNIVHRMHPIDCNSVSQMPQSCITYTGDSCHLLAANLAALNLLTGRVAVGCSGGNTGSSEQCSCTVPNTYKIKKQCDFLAFNFYDKAYDRLCGLVVRVLGYRSGGPGSIPGTTRKKKVGGLERGPFSLVSTTEELLDRKVAAPV
jgi:hypothetical protein